MTWLSTPRLRSQCANQNPSRPASKIVRPVFAPSARQRLSKASSADGSGSSFFCGWRSSPGTVSPTSQLEWLSSTAAIRVVSCSRATRDRLRSSIWVVMGNLHQSDATTMVCHSLALRPTASQAAAAPNISHIHPSQTPRRRRSDPNGISKTQSRQSEDNSRSRWLERSCAAHVAKSPQLDHLSHTTTTLPKIVVTQ
jgi:hypothetical protein